MSFAERCGPWAVVAGAAGAALAGSRDLDRLRIPPAQPLDVARASPNALGRRGVVVPGAVNKVSSSCPAGSGTR